MLFTYLLNNKGLHIQVNCLCIFIMRRACITIHCMRLVKKLIYVGAIPGSFGGSLGCSGSG